MNTSPSEETSGLWRPTVDDGPFTLTVDGEIFSVSLRPDDPGSCDYEWISGPNREYGFSSSRHVAYASIQDRAGSPSTFAQMTVDEHRESIRNFLSQINPETGYIGD